jgi:hypothetical protein
MAFTSIDGDTSWQDLAIAEELAASYNLRRQVFGLSTVATPTQATQVYAFVRALQEGVEELMSYNYYGYGAYYGWLSPASALSSYAGQSSYPSPMTIAAAMTAAGLTASGYWRRIAEGGTQPATWTNYSAAGWSYGKVTDKDLAGPWLFKDLQLALSVLTRAQLRHTQGRIRSGSYSGSVSAIPSTAMSWGSWGSSASPSFYNVGKTKTGASITDVSALLQIAEIRVDMIAAPATCETDRVWLTIPDDLAPSYASKASKMAFANLGVVDVSTVIDQTVTNTTSKSTASGTTSYNTVLGEDAANLIPISNDILPDSNVPSDTTRFVDLYFDVGRLIIDFAFE